MSLVLSVTKVFSYLIDFLTSIISSSKPFVFPFETLPRLSRMSFIVLKLLVVDILKFDRSR